MVIASSTYITGANNKGGFIWLFPIWPCPVDANGNYTQWGFSL